MNSLMAEDKKNENDSIPVLKSNEIFINITPILVPMFEGSSNLAKYSIKYKRKDKSQNHSFRVGINHVEKAFSGSYQESFSTNDTTRILQKFQSPSASNTWIDIGWEFVKYYKRMEQFYGADLFLGSYQEKYSIHKEIYKKNSSGLYDQIIYEDNSYNYSENRIGLSPFWGLKYRMSDHLMLSAQVALDISYKFGELNFESTNGTTSSTPFNIVTFKVGTPGIINDISVIFAF